MSPIGPRIDELSAALSSIIRVGGVLRQNNSFLSLGDLILYANCHILSTRELVCHWGYFWGSIQGNSGEK